MMINKGYPPIPLPFYFMVEEQWHRLFLNNMICGILKVNASLYIMLMTED